jgi:hypothetical protein
MASVATPGPFSTRPLDQLRETAEGTALNRTVGALDLTALGLLIYAVYGYGHSQLRRGA